MKSFSIIGLISAPRTAVTVGTATWSTGIATIVNLIPAGIGKVASLSGAVLSMVLIVLHILKSRRDGKEKKLRIEKLEHEKQIIIEELARTKSIQK